jgi:hypothetical protein
MEMTKSPAFAPVEGLVDLACRDGVDIRPTLLRVLTDLYVQKPTHSAEEEAQYVELAGRLIRSVDRQTLAAVAGRLAGYRNAPMAVMRLLNVPEEFPEPMLSWTSDSVLLTPPEPADEPGLSELFFSASAFERRLILITLDAVAGELKEPAANPESVHAIERAALKHDNRALARELDRVLHIGYSLAHRVVEDASGEPILVAAKALGTPAEVLQRILLFSNPSIGHSVQRVYDLTRLYDEFSVNAARHMIGIWRGESPAPRAEHQSVHAPEAPVRARRAATPAHYHFDETFEELPAPFEIGAR